MSAMVFVSHSHGDQAQAEALVEYLLAALDLEPEALRCTSVPGHQLPFGRTISEQLKIDINASAAILVLLTQTSIQSNWVMFELGASWALGKIVVPILGSSITPTALPGPLSAYPYLAVDASDASSRMSDAVAQIASELGLRERSGGKRDAKLRVFLTAAHAETQSRPAPNAALAMAFEIPWLILLMISGNAKFPAAIYPQIRYYMARLGISSAMPIENYIKLDDEGKAAMDLIAELGGALSVQHPELTTAYESGANLMPLAARGKVAEVKAAVDRMPIPDELKTPRQDLLAWLNAIHEYFEQGLHSETKG